MPDQLISVLDGNTFIVSDRHGDVRPEHWLHPHGFFSEDTRFVSQWELTVSGGRPEVLSTAHVFYFVAQFFLVPPTTTLHAAAPLSIVRQRVVKDVWLEQLILGNHLEEPLDVALDLAVATDFADLFEVKDARVRHRDVVAIPGEDELVLRYRNGPFVRETRITVSEPATIEPDAVRLRLTLAPREERTVTFVVTPSANNPTGPPSRAVRPAPSPRSTSAAGRSWPPGSRWRR